MEIVITMAGLGKRFRDAGYNVPKYMIEAHGKSLFEWSMESLKAFRRSDDIYSFIVRKEDNAGDFIRNKCAEMGIAASRVIELDYQTDGQATTAMLAGDYWNKEAELLIYNIDTYVEAYEMTPEEIKGDGFIPCFNAPGEHWSFVKLSDDGKAIEVREKQKISDNCTLGAYYFKSCGLYEQLYNEYYSDSSKLEKGEKYVAPLYNYMISKGQEIYISNVAYEKVHVLGTPSELEVFINEYTL